MSPKQVDLNARSNVHTIGSKPGDSCIAPGEGGRWYIIIGDRWLSSFPSEGAAVQWLAHRINYDDEEADDRLFQKLGGEWSE